MDKVKVKSQEKQYFNMRLRVFLMLTFLTTATGTLASPLYLTDALSGRGFLFDLPSTGNVTNTVINNYTTINQTITNITNVTNITGGNTSTEMITAVNNTNIRVNYSNSSGKCYFLDNVTQTNLFYPDSNPDNFISTWGPETDPRFQANFSLFNPFYNMTTPAISWVQAQNYLTGYRSTSNVTSLNCSGSDKVTGINANSGVIFCGTDQTGGGSSITLKAGISGTIADAGSSTIAYGSAFSGTVVCSATLVGSNAATDVPQVQVCNTTHITLFIQKGHTGGGHNWVVHWTATNQTNG